MKEKEKEEGEEGKREDGKKGERSIVLLLFHSLQPVPSLQRSGRT